MNRIAFEQQIYALTLVGYAVKNAMKHRRESQFFSSPHPLAAFEVQSAKEATHSKLEEGILPKGRVMMLIAGIVAMYLKPETEISRAAQWRVRNFGFVLAVSCFCSQIPGHCGSVRFVKNCIYDQSRCLLTSFTSIPSVRGSTEERFAHLFRATFL